MKKDAAVVPWGPTLRMMFPVALMLGGGLLLIVILGLAQRVGWLRSTESAPATTADGTAADAAATIYTCPMHPQIRQPGKGRCPICGMELVPAGGGSESDLDRLSVTIQPAQRRLANIQTAPVERGQLESEIHSIGLVSIDESRQATIAAYVDGRLERLYADYTGLDINRGDHLAVVYSPQLYGAQVEYLEARRVLAASGGVPAVRQAQEALVANTRQRLREFGMTDQQLADLESTGTAASRLTIYAPQGGTVIEKLAVEGNYVKAGEPIYRIADLSTVWLMLKLFPEDAARVRFGQRVEATIQSLPGEKLAGRVAFIDPTVDPQTRTVGVRVELVNDQRRLRPGDYGEARITMTVGQQGEVFDETLAGKWISPMHPQIIRDQPGQCPVCGMDLVPTSRFGFSDRPVTLPTSVYVPRSAVLMAGGSSVVYVETDPGRFEIRPITIGPVLRDKVAILAGLEVGEQVATAGNFLIDSQMQLAGKPSLIDASRIVERPAGSSPPQEVRGPASALAGDAGVWLESVFAGYVAVQQSLAADRVPSESIVNSLREPATRLASAEGLSDEVRRRAGEVVKHAEHLHHLDIAGARLAFKEISRTVIELATGYRGSGSAEVLRLFHCPMVPGGGGDWLQFSPELLNPYFGAQMLRCGEKVQDLPLPAP